tara:strand:- start:164 stop:433 length:270 start_codon:yes stop_codon:yes gene_type:complete
MLVRKYESQEEVPTDLKGIFEDHNLIELLDKIPEGEIPGKVEVLYSYPTGGLVIHSEDEVCGHHLKLTSAEFDARKGVKIRATYLVRVI